jgi:DNA polymerase-3 subunit delta'
MSLKGYPWLSEVVDSLPERLPAALLLHGQKGVGKLLLAQTLSQGLLCTEPGGVGHPCGHCESCHLFTVGNHPDFRLLQPAADAEGEDDVKPDPDKGSKSKKPSTQISVDAVRDLAGLTSNASHQGGSRVILVSAAESLHPAAANALLKMLEEPGRDTYFILVASERNRVLPTIKSRCFQLAVRVPSVEIGTAWLKEQHAGHAEAALYLASQAPFAALKLSEDDAFWASRGALMAGLAEASADPLSLAGTAEKLDPAALGRLLTMWVFDLLALQQGGDVHYHRDMKSELDRTAGKVDGKDLCRWSDEVRDFTRAASHPLNRRLALESLFASWPGSHARVGASNGR